MENLLHRKELMRSVADRSQLAPVAPIVSQKWGLESLPSYMNRLARHNDLKPDHFIREFGKSRFGNPVSFSRCHTRSAKAELKLAFDHVYATRLNEVMESACADSRIHDLYTHDTQLILDTIEKGSPDNYKWCPICISESPVRYFPLHWQLTSVNCCHIHGKELTSTCGNCGKKPTLLKSNSVIGYCNHCGSDLSASKYYDEDVSEEESNKAKQYYKLLSGGFGM